MANSAQVVSVDGHRLTLTHLDKVMYPETGTTKGDVLAYYAAVAEFLIPHAMNRPATRKRWVHGVGTAAEPGMSFFQKNLDASAPSWVKRRAITHKDHVNEYPLVNDLATLTWLGQMAALEIHVPQWQFNRAGVPRNPDRLVLDLDPGDGVSLPECAEVARFARVILQDMGLEPMPVTSGSKGIHLYAALDRRATSDQVSQVAHELARALEADHPDLIVSDMKKAKRPGKVFVDWSQNSASKTTITPYSLRGRSRPMVAVPRTWRELASADLAHLDYEQVMKRMTRRDDPLAVLFDAHPDAREPEPDAHDASEPEPDRLTLYRSKRDAAKTPEPIPASVAPDSGNSFVIQEHHARNLHWDFRLEHDGVLASWALPKGVPTEGTKNHLAVQVEDHPLEYGSFEGEIPRGEYGAGTVSIWDSGTYDLEKWRDDEVIVTLHGLADGGLGGQPRRFALIRTGGGNSGRAPNNWLIHQMKQQGVAPATPGNSSSNSKSGSNSKAGSSRASARATAGSSRAPAQGRFSPMLATAGTEADLMDASEWAFEMKWDGIRAIAYLDRSATPPVRLVSRNGIDVTTTYPEIVEALPDHVGATSAVLDGEIIAADSSGRPSFGALQNRMNRTSAHEVAAARRHTPVQYMLFDVLERDGESLTGQGYEARRGVLLDLVTPGGSIQAPPSFDGDFETAFDTSLELKLEGVMAKRRDSTYSAGTRSHSWIKVKHHLTQEVVIGGWRLGNGYRAKTIGSLLVGIPEGGGLRYAGRVGTGFSDRDLERIATTLAPLVRDRTPFIDVPPGEARDATWVEPALVGEVEFAEWTDGDRLRHPSWRGLRPDKTPDDVTRES